MAFLYGDSTPFPLDDNFIETLRSSTDICIALLRADEAMDAVMRNVEEEKIASERDLRGVEGLVSSVARALEPHQSAPESPYVESVCTRLLQTARSVIDTATKDVQTRRDSALRQAETRLAAERSRVPQALERFLLGHELPSTQWSISWMTRRGTTQTQTQTQANAWALARTAMGLEATFELEVPASSMWSRPFKVADVKAELPIQLPHKGGWLDRSGATREERLDRYYVTEVSVTPQRAAMVLRKATKPTGPGMEISLLPERRGKPTLKLVGEESAPDEGVVLEGLDGAAVQELWDMLEPRLRPLVRKRVRLAQALLEGSPLNEIQSPARVAQLLIGVMAPYVREMGRRSPVAGELVLKRQVEDGRREELFISIHELTDKFATLTPERQAFFNEYGLVYDVQESGSGETTEEPEVSSRAAMPARVSGEISARGRVSSGAVAAAAPAGDVQSKG